MARGFSPSVPAAENERKSGRRGGRGIPCGGLGDVPLPPVPARPAGLLPQPGARAAPGGASVSGRTQAGPGSRNLRGRRCAGLRGRTKKTACGPGETPAGRGAGPIQPRQLRRSRRKNSQADLAQPHRGSIKNRIRAKGGAPQNCFCGAPLFACRKGR